MPPASSLPKHVCRPSSDTRSSSAWIRAHLRQHSPSDACRPRSPTRRKRSDRPPCLEPRLLRPSRPLRRRKPFLAPPCCTRARCTSRNLVVRHMPRSNQLPQRPSSAMPHNQPTALASASRRRAPTSPKRRLRRSSPAVCLFVHALSIVHLHACRTGSAASAADAEETSPHYAGSLGRVPARRGGLMSALRPGTGAGEVPTRALALGRDLGKPRSALRREVRI